MKSWLIALILLVCTDVFWTADPNDRLQELGNKLQSRVLKWDSTAAFIPPIGYKPDLPANARYEDGKIWIGTIQSDYHTLGDSLSILYHEYQHHLQALRQQFLICEDSLGNIPQWSTGEMYVHVPDSAEIARDVQQATGPWIERYEEPRRSKELGRLKRDLSRPRKILFVYAPSRLAEAEIDAYQEQLLGEERGFYQLSQEANAAIQRRLKQLKGTLERRTRYEQEHFLSPDGCEK